MGDLLAQLEFVLRSSKETLTAGEERILQACKSKAIRDFTFGACVASVVTWAATRKLTVGYRLNYTGGAAVASGMWSFNRSLNSCLNQILDLDGSRMQMALTNIILAKHRDDPRKIKLLRKHFYPEEVFVDSTPDQPLFRWRHRNVFGDNVSEGSPDNVSEDRPEALSGYRSNELEPKSLVADVSERKQEEDMIADPLDCIFGNAGHVEEIQGSKSSSSTARRRVRGHKRAHRRRRHHSEHPLENADEHYIVT